MRVTILYYLEKLLKENRKFNLGTGLYLCNLFLKYTHTDVF